MKVVALNIFSLLVFSLSTLAQELDYSEEVKIYLTHNGTLGQYESAYDELLNMLQNQFPETDDNKKGWVYLKENKGKSVDQMLTLLVPIYQAHFKRDEIQQMTNFYQSETGIQLLKNRSQLTELQKEELNAYYNSELGKRVISKQTVLSQEIPIVSENWSRDLYETALSLLK